FSVTQAMPSSRSTLTVWYFVSAIAIALLLTAAPWRSPAPAPPPPHRDAAAGHGQATGNSPTIASARRPGKPRGERGSARRERGGGGGAQRLARDLHAAGGEAREVDGRREVGGAGVVGLDGAVGGLERPVPVAERDIIRTRRDDLVGADDPRAAELPVLRQGIEVAVRRGDLPARAAGPRV